MINTTPKGSATISALEGNVTNVVPTCKLNILSFIMFHFNKHCKQHLSIRSTVRKGITFSGFIQRLSSLIANLHDVLINHICVITKNHSLGHQRFYQMYAN